MSAACSHARVRRRIPNWITDGESPAGAARLRATLLVPAGPRLPAPAVAGFIESCRRTKMYFSLRRLFGREPAISQHDQEIFLDQIVLLLQAREPVQSDEQSHRAIPVQQNRSPPG